MSEYNLMPFIHTWLGRKYCWNCEGNGYIEFFFFKKSQCVECDGRGFILDEEIKEHTGGYRDKYSSNKCLISATDQPVLSSRSKIGGCFLAATRRLCAIIVG